MAQSGLSSLKVIYYSAQLLDLCNLRLLVVILVVLTASQFRFSLLISHLKAKAIPVRGAN
ncbi:hypothetical protein EAO14_08665 [Klebsiella pneumoniae]|nr:hypothetical protein EAO14_08665 [Klebsiella pneumoniae]